MAKRRMGNNVNLLAAPGKPTPNDRHQIFFRCPPDDVIASLLFLLAVETDAGLLLQTTEIMRIILDTDMLGDHGPMGVGQSVEDNETPPSFSISQSNGKSNGSTAHSIVNQETDQHQFLSPLLRLLYSVACRPLPIHNIVSSQKITRFSSVGL
jgi:hypothetical protein